MKPRTLAEIARLAGVSRTTASYVINGKAHQHRISPRTVERVMAVVDTHHFQVDAQAAALRRGATRTLGFILPDLENSSYARLAKLLERGAREAGYQLLIVGSNDEPETERALARSLRARRCDALITASRLEQDSSFYRELMADGLPVIAVDRQLDPRYFRCVTSDNRDAAARLTTSVIKADMMHIAWFEAVPELSISNERRAGFEAALAVGAPRAQKQVHIGHYYDRVTGNALMHRQLEQAGMPDALVTASYALLEGALDVLLEVLVAQPSTTPPRIATFGDNRLLDFLPMRVNSLPQQHERIAALALRRALAAIEGEYEPGCDIVERRLIQR
ncbi:catabolite repressor/activator [Kushneria phosphatilytica]|uniref:Catabolite repressor/activator n=1 Tax=Kushneria phosphatilytica TaxID=657387 RepID=A0A1S1NZA4_9GAMM|nr:catabolite repressor/activator [Kushneria phosphatilytica]OHV13814.1 DNA-binding transcriptional regulator FruR [Kushneria phosphatilytica]QEL10367.1 catabolite repressor/activator [Kushneria phosphatilytica]